jgi:hypothetical protein
MESTGPLAGQYHLYSGILDFLEQAYDQFSQDGAQQLLLLTYAKVVNDCRAMLLLERSGYHIQAGILARSTMDTCSLMMHIGFEGESAPLVEQWRAGQRVTHWKIVDTLNAPLEPDQRLSFDDYREVRSRLDELVHATQGTLELYRKQWPGTTSRKEGAPALTFWASLLQFYVVTCLLVVQLIAPDRYAQAQVYLDRLHVE